MYKYSEIKESFKIEVSKNGTEKPAFLTHFLQGNKNDLPAKYKIQALNFFNNTQININDAVKNGLTPEELLRPETKIRWDVPFPPPEKPLFTFIDLFAGIGGFRIAMQNLGGKCVFSSEIDYHAKITYEKNFGEIPFGDITRMETKEAIPKNFNILCAGFPCQAFSIAGKRKGFDDTRGTLFFEIAEILKNRKPEAFFLENVKGLRNHHGGKTLKRILEVLRDDLNYYVPEPKIINARDFGVPQNRERIFIVGFKNKKISSFEYPKPTDPSKRFSDIKEKNVPVKYYISKQYLNTLILHKDRHAEKGNGFGYEIIEDNEVSNAIVVGGMGKERNLVIDDTLTNFIPTTHIKGEVNRQGIRKMTPREWARLQGYPEKFKIEVADVHAYRQFGNSVAIPAIQATAQKILEKLNKQ